MMKAENKKWMIILPLIMAGLLILGMWLGSKLTSEPHEQYYTDLEPNKIDILIDYIVERYVDPVDKNEMIETTLPLLLKSLDPHSIYIPADEMLALNEPLHGEFDGIGIQFNVLEDTIVVINTISGGPSALLGILPGDRIVMIDDSIFVGKNLDSDDVMKKLRGKNGTIVKVQVKRRGIDELIPYEITRDKIPLYSVDVGYMMDDNVGYVKISRFSRTTHQEFLETVEKLNKQGMKKIILDLRGNGGGYMDAATDIVDEFLESGKLIVYTEGKAQPRSSTNSKAGGACVDKEVVVLIDEWAASASEILAGAIQDNDRGTIVGRRSFGKGLVQEPTEFMDGSGLRLTIARYYTPTGRCIQKPYDESVEDYYHDISNRIIHGEFEDKDSINFTDSLKFVTPGGKVVYGGGGIMPDVFVPVDTIGTSAYLTKVSSKALVYKYSFEYVDSNRDNMKKLETVKEIKAFLNNKNILNDFVAFAEKNGVEKDFDGLKISGKILEIQIKASIARNLLDDEGYYPIIRDIDASLIKAYQVFNN